MTDFLKIAKSIVVHFAHICAYGVETVNKNNINIILTSKMNLESQNCKVVVVKL